MAGARHARHFVEWAEQRRLLASEQVIGDIDTALPELRVAFGWLMDRGEVELAGRLVVALATYGVLRLRPEVLGWAERVVVADTDDCSPMAAPVWATASYAAWMAGDVAEAGVRSAHAVRLGERTGDLPAVVAMVVATSRSSTANSTRPWTGIGGRRQRSPTTRRCR